MDNLTDNLFLAVSEKVGIRVTPENLRTQLSAINGVGGITNDVKTSILIELLIGFAALEKKIDETRTKTEETTV